MNGNIRDFDVEEFKRQIEDSLEEQGVSDAIQRGALDFEQPQNPVEQIQQFINPAEHYLSKHPELSRDYGTSFLPDQRMMWVIYNNLENSMHMKNLGLSPEKDESNDELYSNLAILLLAGSLYGQRVKAVKTNWVGVDREEKRSGRGWLRR